VAATRRCTGSYQRRAADSVAAARRSNLLEPDDDIDEDSRGGPLAAVGYTVIWYGVPVVLFVLYMLVVTGDEKAHALSTSPTRRRSSVSRWR
jgi:hypothetical protein